MGQNLSADYTDSAENILEEILHSTLINKCNLRKLRMIHGCAGLSAIVAGPPP